MHRNIDMLGQLCYIAVPYGNTISLTMLYRATSNDIPRAGHICTVDFFEKDYNRQFRDADNGLKIALFISAACRGTYIPLEEEDILRLENNTVSNSSDEIACENDMDLSDSTHGSVISGRDKDDPEYRRARGNEYEPSQVLNGSTTEAIRLALAGEFLNARDLRAQSRAKR